MWAPVVLVGNDVGRWVAKLLLPAPAHRPCLNEAQLQSLSLEAGLRQMAQAGGMRPSVLANEGPPQPDLFQVRTLYEGPAGPRSRELLKNKKLVVTSRAVEIETEGANACMTAATLGCWYFFFQTCSIEIFELTRITSLFMESDCIVGEIESPAKRTLCGKNARFRIDLESPQDTRNLYFHLKDAWNAANNAGDDEDDGMGDAMVPHDVDSFHGGFDDADDSEDAFEVQNR